MINIILFENAFYLIKGEDTFRTFKFSFLHILGTLCVQKSANCPCFSLQRGHLTLFSKSWIHPRLSSCKQLNYTLN